MKEKNDVSLSILNVIIWTVNPVMKVELIVIVLCIDSDFSPDRLNTVDPITCK